MSNNSSRKFICSPVSALGETTGGQQNLLNKLLDRTTAVTDYCTLYVSSTKSQTFNDHEILDLLISHSAVLSISKAIIQILLDFYQKHFSRLNQLSQQQMEKIIYSMYV